MFPSLPFFCVMFSTLLKQIPEPVQNIALSFGWSSFGVTVPIVLARLSVTYCVPRFSSLVVKSRGSTINCLNWSFLSKPASNPWNLWMVVAQAGTRGQYVTLQHDCFWLQNLVIMAMGTCCTSRWAETHKPHLSGIQNNLRITTPRKPRLPGYFLQFEKFPDRQKHRKS